MSNNRMLTPSILYVLVNSTFRDFFFPQNVTLQLLSGTNKSSMSKKEDEEESDDVKQTEKELHQNVHENGEREDKEEEKEEETHVVEVAFKQVSEPQVNQKVASEEEAKTVSESETQSQAEPLQASDLHSVSSAGLKPEVEQEQGEHSIPETTTEQKDTIKSADPDDEPDENSSPENGQETVSEPNASLNSKVARENVDNSEHVEEMNAASQKAFGPPANPPPPPNALQNNPGEDTR